MSKVYWVTEPTLKTTVLVIRGDSRAKAIQTVLDYGVREMADPHYDGRGFVKRVLPEEHKKGHTFWILYYGTELTLVHECVHLAIGTLDDRGIPINEHNDEIIAYHTGFWYHCIRDEIRVAELEDDIPHKLTPPKHLSKRSR